LKATNDKATHLPGELGVWMFILGDMLVFSLLFFSYAWDRRLDSYVFRESQVHLDSTFGVINTLLLLLGSLFVVLALYQEKALLHQPKNATPFQQQRKPRLLLLAAIACGVCFIVSKIAEYTDKIAEGHTLLSNDFFMYYFMMTGLHLVHVCVGIGLLTFLVVRLRNAPPSQQVVGYLESGGAVWHMVDLLWIVMFPLLYLVS